MRKTFIVMVALWVSASLLACTPVQKEEFVAPGGYDYAEIGESTGAKNEGIGVEFDPHFFSQNVTRGVKGLTAESWSIVEKRVTDMKVQKFRVMILPGWLEPENDNNDSNVTDFSKLTVDSVEMQSLYKVLDLAEKVGAEVNLAFWGVSKSVALAADNYIDKPYWMAEGNNAPNWVVGAKGDMVYEWCENISAYLTQLIKNKKYSCITEVTPGNEPDWSYQIDTNTGDITEYMRMCLELDKRLKKDNLRDLVRLNLVDSTDVNSHKWLDAAYDHLDGIADSANSHTYIFGYETPNSTVADWQRKNTSYAKAFGANHFVGEFGSNQCVGSTQQIDIDKYERGVLMSRLVSQFFNNGASGMSYWSLFDQYNNKRADYSAMMQTGLWMSAKEEYKSSTNYNNIKEDFQLRYQYYAYSMLTSKVPRGADIYPILLNEEFVSGTMFSKDNKNVYLFANNSSENKNYYIKVNPGTKYEIYRYHQDIDVFTGELLGVEKVENSTNCSVKFNLDGQTVLLIREI